jgi:hypothetical protein
MIRIADMVTNYSRLQKTLPGQHDLWLRRLRDAAWQDVETFGFPNLKTEAWKYTRLHTLLQQEFSLATPGQIH